MRKLGISLFIILVVTVRYQALVMAVDVAQQNYWKEQFQAAPSKPQRELMPIGSDSGTGTSYRLLWQKGFSNPQPCSEMLSFKVLGEVPDTVDVAQEEIARRFIFKGHDLARQYCPRLYHSVTPVEVKLYRVGSLEGKFLAMGSVFHDPKSGTDDIGVSTYVNPAKEDKDRRLREEAEAKRRVEGARLAEERARQYAEEQARQQAAYRAEQDRIAKAQAEKREQTLQRWTAFSKEQGVQKLLTLDALSLNPFVYQGQVVALRTNFEQMTTEDTGLFTNGSGLALFSGIPQDIRARFTARYYVVVVGRVLGKADVSVPPFGQMSVPHLKFIGVHFCNDA